MKPMTVDYRPAVRLVRNAARAADNRAFVFNDRLQNGSRSVKVWGWKKQDYMKAAADIRKMGYNAEVKDVGAKMGWGFVRSTERQYRLHIS